MMLPDPTTTPRFEPVAPDARAAILAAVSAGDAAAMGWADKARRFASLHGRNLADTARRRLGAEAAVHLEWIAALQMAVTRQNRPDAASLSAAAFCRDAGAKGATGSLADDLETACQILQTALIDAKAGPIAPSAMGHPFAVPEGQWRSEACTAAPMALFSPNPYSLYSLSVLEICLKLGVPVTALIVRRFTLARARQEWRRDGKRLMRKVWRKLVLRADENADPSAVSMASVHRALSSGATDVRKLARANGIPVIEVDEFKALPTDLTAIEADTALFTGGGMVGQPVIARFPGGVINVHMGCLPAYKGMDVVQAPILEGCFDAIGLTAHRMVPALDAGPVATVFTCCSDAYGALGSLRNEISALMPWMCVDAALGLASGRILSQDQTEPGRQYYVLHPRLEAVLAPVLSARAKPGLSNSIVDLVAQAQAELTTS